MTQTADQMRADLQKVIPDDPELIEATIKRYMANLAYKRPKPVVCRGTKSGPKPSESQYKKDMREASNTLGFAIDAMVVGRKIDVPEKLRWRVGEQEYSQTNLKRQGEAVERQLQRKAMIDELRVEQGSPCFRCGAARSCNCRGQLVEAA